MADETKTSEEIEKANKLIGDGLQAEKDLFRTLENITQQRKKTVETLQEEVKALQSVTDLGATDYANRQRAMELRTRMAELDAKILVEMRKQILVGQNTKEVLATLTEEERKRFEALGDNLKEVDKLLNATELGKKVQEEINEELLYQSSLQAKVTKAAMKTVLILEQGQAAAMLMTKVWAGGMDKVIESTVRQGWELIVQFDAQTKAMERQLQLGPVYTERVKSNWKALNEYGVSLEGATKAEMALVKTVTDYTLMAPAQQEQLSRSAALTAELGVGIDDYSQGVQNSMKMFGQSMTGAITTQGELAATARALGRDQGEFAAEFAKSGHALAKFGTQGVKAFKDLQHIAKITGMEMGKVLDITNQFDTFEGAAEQAGKLNAALGGNFVNAMDLMMATDPAERFSMIRDSILDAGLTFDDMSYYQKNFYKDALGLSDVGDLALMLSGDMDQLAGSTELSSEQWREQKERAQSVMDIQKAFRAILENNAEEFVELAGTVQTFMQIMLDLADVIKWGGLALMAFRVVQMGSAAWSLIQAYRTGTLTAAMIANGVATTTNTGLTVADSVADEINTVGKIGNTAAIEGNTVAQLQSIPATQGAGAAAGSAAPMIIALGAAILMVGAGIFLAATGFALLGDSIQRMTDTQLESFTSILIGFGVGLLGVVLILAGLAASGLGLAAAGLLLALGQGIALIGLGVGIAAAGIGLMGVGMAKMFDAVDQEKMTALGGFFFVLATSALIFATAASGLMGLGLALAGFSLAMIGLNTEKLTAFADFAKSLSNISDVTNLQNIKAEIKAILKTIEDFTAWDNVISFTNSMDALADLSALELSREAIATMPAAVEQTTMGARIISDNASTAAISAATVERAAAGTAAAAENVNAVKEATAPRTGLDTGEVVERIRQPIVFQVKDDKLASYILNVVGRRIQEINVV